VEESHLNEADKLGLPLLEMSPVGRFR
jgi:hypothetical protein